MSINIRKIYSFIINSLFLLSFTYFPDYIFNNTMPIYKGYCLIIYFLIIILYMKKYKFKIHYMNILIAIIYIIPVISTFNNGNRDMLSHSIRLLLEMFSLSLYIEYNIKERKMNFLRDCMIYYGILVIANIISFYMYFPQGMYNIKNFYFLGNDNGSIYETFLFLFISILYFLKEKNKIPIKFYAILTFIFAGYLYVDSGNGKVCTFLFLILSLIYSNNKNRFFDKIVNIKNASLTYIITFFMLVIWRSNNLIIGKVLEILKKDPTFTGRTIIWDRSFYWINQHLIFGNGYENQKILLMKILQVKPHNIIIQFLYNGGIIMLIGLIVYLIIMLKKLYESRFYNKLYSVIVFCLLMYFVISIFDYYYYKTTLVFMLSIVTFMEYLKEDSNEKTKNKYNSSNL